MSALQRQEQCPLCGTTFDAAGQGCRPSCPMAKGCHVVCCPSCGYSFPQEAGVAAGLRKLLDRFHRRTEATPPPQEKRSTIA